MVKNVLYELAGRYPNATIINYLSPACWIRVKAGPISFDGKIWAPCSTECCEYQYETINNNEMIGVIKRKQSIPELIECPGIPEYLRQCFAVCDPLGYVTNQAL